MGMNYYLKINICTKCNRHDLVHIGKQSFGWAFLFSDRYPDKKSWKKMIDRSTGVYIVNEYGDKVGRKKFWEMIEATKNKLNAWTYEKEQEGKVGIYRPYDPPEKYEYLDPEGYRMGRGEFS